MITNMSRWPWIQPDMGYNAMENDSTILTFFFSLSQPDIYKNNCKLQNSI